jgi:energy-coupling factor transport system substrate-specific component
MSWQLAAFTLLGLALAGGFAWYERARPDARVVALVATMAALAALGRIAFAALPNVKPSTDIVLISGYALGGAPGFVVGALTGLVSNFFFGQGPWTPWQMAAWGMAGLIGAGLARATAGRIGRWPLALVCAAVGFAFTAFQDFGDWVTYSDHSLAQLGLYVGRGTGFDLVHAAACLSFALAFGPALARSLKRFTMRLDVVWQHAPAGPLALAAALVLAGGISLAGAGTLGAPSSARANNGARTPTSYLLAAQNRDGGLGAAPGQPSSPLYSGWAALGLAAEGVDPANTSHGGRNLLAYVLFNPGGADSGSIERTILAARAAGTSAPAALLGALEHDFARDGSVSHLVNQTSFAVLAMRAAGAPLPPGTVGWLLRQQNHDGGFGFGTAGGGSDVDDTAAALEALVAGRASGSATARAAAYIRSQQNRDGGFPTAGVTDSNAQSTAWAVQGLIAAGQSPATVHRPRGANPLQYLTSLIAPDGHVRYSRHTDQTPVWVTAEAAMALAGKPLPLTPPPPAKRFPAHRVAASRATHPVHRAVRRPRRSEAPAHSGRRDRLPVVVPPTTALPADAAVATAVVLAPLGIE